MSSWDFVISNCVLCTLLFCKSSLVVAPVDPSEISGKYAGCCWQFNVDPVRMRYKDGLMNRPFKPFTLPPSIRVRYDYSI